MKGLSIQNIESGYADKIVINGLSLDVEGKETLIIMGPSGSGKSTLLLTILGIIPPGKGRIFLNDRDITNTSIEEHCIGYLPQDYGLFTHLNVMENVSYGLRIRGIPKNEREKKSIEMLKLVELENYKEKRIKELSGGEKQRVGLARALAIEPCLLLLDEPLSNIDQVTKSDIAKQLKELFNKIHIPVILVTHNHEDAIFLAGRIAILIDGKIEQIGNIGEIMRYPKTPFIKKLLTPFVFE
ncbi:MAG: ABC transporter ATP-binding protein [bacterium]|nr:ABC transporter ATP-binding protein [bacterium]